MPYFEGEKYPEYGLQSRGRHATFSSAVAAAFSELGEEIATHPFEQQVSDNFKRLFPKVPAWPGKFDPETGYFDILVKNSASMFMLKPRLKTMEAKLRQLPGAPANFKAVLQIAIR